METSGLDADLVNGCAVCERASGCGLDGGPICQRILQAPWQTKSAARLVMAMITIRSRVHVYHAKFTNVEEY